MSDCGEDSEERLQDKDENEEVNVVLPVHFAAPRPRPKPTSSLASCTEVSEDAAARRAANISALLNNSLETQRTVMSRFLTLQQSDLVIRRAFVSPRPGAPAVSEALRTKLAARRRFVPWGDTKPWAPPATSLPPRSPQVELTPLPSPPSEPPPPPPLAKVPAPAPDLPPDIEPLVLWAPPLPPSPPHPPAAPPPSSGAALQGEVRVDAQLVRWLRPHQREGLAFMFDCVMGLRLAGGRGCILADDMGLGKTLQGLALLWTLLTAPAHPDLMAVYHGSSPGPGGGGPGAGAAITSLSEAGGEQGGGLGQGGLMSERPLGAPLSPAAPGVCGGEAGLGPIARRALIVCPTSLVSNWDSEARKWLGGRLATLALCKASKEEVVEGIQHFLHPSNPYKVLIVSYETFRLHGDRFNQPGSCDLLICDEAHRLKNDATLTNRALGSLPCKRRVLLSGTPMQNHLDEFYAMVDFANPGVLGTPTEFRRSYEVPILAAREPGASPEAAALGAERSLALSTLVNAFILRRTNSLLSAHLPPKVVQVVCCKLMPLQHAIYCHFLESKAARKILGGRGTSGVLPAISNLKKLCNHPKLIYDAVHSVVVQGARKGKGGGKSGDSTAGFEGVAALFPPCLFDDGRPGRGGCAPGWETTSGKFAVATRMLALLWAETQDRIVIVSNYTQTLDLFGQLCRERGWPFLRLDGSTSIEKREKLVQAFCDPSQNQFVFLLSSKAGGCGLNLVGGNRLLLYDCDWNPAVDKQAAARVWRDGQQKRVFVYRFLATGTIEEKVFQRQISKEGLQALVANANEAQVTGDTTDSKPKGGAGRSSNLMSQEELRELFSLHPDTLSHTYEVVQRKQQEAANALAVAALLSTTPPALDLTSGLLMQTSPGPEAEEPGGQHLKGAGCLPGGGPCLSPPCGPGIQAHDSLELSHLFPDLLAPISLGIGQLPVYKEQEGQPMTEEELHLWGHHSDPTTVPDPVLARVAGDDVSFVFSCKVAGKAVEDAGFAPRTHTLGRGPASTTRASGLKRPLPCTDTSSAPAAILAPVPLTTIAPPPPAPPAAPGRPKSCGRLYRPPSASPPPPSPTPRPSQPHARLAVACAGAGRARLLADRAGRSSGSCGVRGLHRPSKQGQMAAPQPTTSLSVVELLDDVDDLADDAAS